MKDVKRDFQERCDEIDLYFSFMEKVAKRGSKITLSDGTVNKIESVLAKTLKANGFILLYNLVESSIKKAVEEIYVKMKQDGAKYDDVKESIKREIIIFLKNKKNTEEFIKSVNFIAEDIIEQCFSSKTLFSGNVDAKEIRETSKKYGFSTATNNRVTKGGKELLTVKTHRNDLAHGVFSFQEVGKNFTPQEMLRIKKEVTSYIKQILDNIEDYITKKEFLK